MSVSTPVSSSSNLFPFQSKAAIKARLAEDPSFVLECLQIMDARQTEDEQATLSTKWSNKRGWMSSHAVWGGKLALKARTGELSDEEFSKAAGMVCRYTKQLAAHFRAEAIAKNPALEAVARIFSAG